jgi:VanZ family protein
MRPRTVISILARVTAWSLLLAVAALTLVPPIWRPLSGLGHNLEHVAAFLLLGAVFTLAYRRHAYSIALFAVVLIGSLEIMQLLIPGRHATFADFLVNALGAIAGVAIVSLVYRR